MNEKVFVLVITGPAGSGKSTTADMLSKQIDHCVNIEVDDVKHMIVSGFRRDESHPSGWGFGRWDLVGDSIGMLAANFCSEGYNVVVNGYLDQAAWSTLQQRIRFTHKVLLLPQLDTIYQRDSRRGEDIRMGGELVARHHSLFCSDPFFDDFVRLDTSDQSEDETVNTIKELLLVSKGWDRKVWKNYSSKASWLRKSVTERLKVSYATLTGAATKSKK